MRHREKDLHRLATALGVATQYTDGLGRNVLVGADTLLQVCAALGADIDRADDAGAALAEVRETARAGPEVVVAWDGVLDPAVARDGGVDAELPLGVHELEVARGSVTVIAAPRTAWRSPAADTRRWGLACHLGALRSGRSRSVGDLADLRTLAGHMANAGGRAITVLPILPTFNDAPAEPSPYSPVSRLFWSELVLDIGPGGGGAVDRIDVTAATEEVRLALRGAEIDPAAVEAELAAYARFRGAQSRLGRNWTTWPAAARGGELSSNDIDPAEEHLHLVAQLAVRDQLAELRADLDAADVTLGLDLAVGVHPEGYDTWSRPHLFAADMAVGAPPDAGFPSGQNWGFSPVLPAASAAEGHAYLRATIAHQASLAGLLRIDHIMALRRLYWIPDGMPLDQGTYVSYPMEELFALVCLESHVHGCEIVGENLGTVPAELDAALVRHRIWGMSLAQFDAGAGDPVADVDPDEVAFIGTHDTPTFAGWLEGNDIDLRVQLGLLAVADAPAARLDRAAAAQRLAAEVGGSVDDPAELLELLIAALGRSASPVVLLWLEDLWLEPDQVNVPGTSSAEHPNWQRPMRRSVDAALADPAVARLFSAIEQARRSPAQPAGAK